MLVLFTSFFSGVLAIFSPCVLPIAPILLLSAWQKHRFGPIALISGLAVTFTVIGMTLAASNSALGFDAPTLHTLFASVLIGVGLVFFSDGLNKLLQSLISPITNLFHSASHKVKLEGLGGQFVLGLLLGGAWLPCTGPTLGLAISLASHKQDLYYAALIMMCYSLGVSTPLIALSYLSHGFFKRKHWLEFGKASKRILGVVLIIVGLLMVTGFEKHIESFLVDHCPIWLLKLTNKY